MFEYTENNHFKFGYQRIGDSTPHWFEDRNSKNDTFIATYGKSSYEPGPFKEECLIVAQKIHNLTTLIPNVLFSGGINSEIVVQSFQQVKAPFKISILRFNNDLNLHQIINAIIYCEMHNLEYNLIDVDILKFQNPNQFNLMLWLVDQIDGLPVLGPRLNKSNISALRYFDRSYVPNFFQYTPELLYSFLKLTDDTFEIYSNHFDIKYRVEYTGFEKLEIPIDEKMEFFPISQETLLKKIKYV